jgi:hypothetical protein
MAEICSWEHHPSTNDSKRRNSDKIVCKSIDKGIFGSKIQIFRKNMPPGGAYFIPKHKRGVWWWKIPKVSLFLHDKFPYGKTNNEE